MPKSKMKKGVGGVGLTLQIHACSLGDVKGERSDNFNIGLPTFEEKSSIFILELHRWQFIIWIHSK